MHNDFFWMSHAWWEAAGRVTVKSCMFTVRKFKSTSKANFSKTKVQKVPVRLKRVRVWHYSFWDLGFHRGQTTSSTHHQLNTFRAWFLHPFQVSPSKYTLTPLFKDNSLQMNLRAGKENCHAHPNFHPSGQEHTSLCCPHTEVEQAGVSVTTQLF